MRIVPRWGAAVLRPYKRRLGRDVGEDFGGVAFGFYVVPGLLDFAVGADEVGDARDALEAATHEFLQAPGAVGLQRFVSGIAEQREIQLLLGFETRKHFFRVRAGSQYGHAGFFKLRFCVAKLGRFYGSTGGVGFREEKEEDAVALKVLERDEFLLVGFQDEVGSFGACFQHNIASVQSKHVIDPAPDGKAASSRRSPNAPAPTTRGRCERKKAA